MKAELYPLAVIALTAIVTWLLRALPFIIFGKRELPDVIGYLGKILPPAIMTILVIYCLKSIDLTAKPFGLPEIISSLLVVILQSTKKSMYLSIIAGTVCYMFLIRVVPVFCTGCNTY